MQQIETKIEEVINKTIEIPAAPFVIIKVIDLVQEDLASISVLEEIILSDQGLTSRLLKIANSPYYGQSRKIKTIKQALLLIGFETFKSLIVAAALKDLHKNMGVFEHKLWEHSLSVGLCSSMLSVVTKIDKPWEVYVCGLVHDMGKTFINNSLPEEYQELYKEICRQKNGDFKGFAIDLEKEKFGFDHTNVGHLVSKSWNFPEKMVEAISCHHSEESVCDKLKYPETCNLVKISDQICNSLGLGFEKRLKEKIDFKSVGLSQDLANKFIQEFSNQILLQKEFFKD